MELKNNYEGNIGGIEEFKRLVADLRAFQGQDRVTRVFQRFDRDKSGSIDVRELAGALFHLEIGSDDYRTAAILKRCGAEAGTLEAASLSDGPRLALLCSQVRHGP